MKPRSLVLGRDQVAAIEDLRARAAAKPLDMAAIVEEGKTPEGAGRVDALMRELTVVIPTGYAVTYSVDVQPCGLCRHMSVAVGTPADKLLPHPGAVQMLAEAFGFEGGMEGCMVWQQELPDGWRTVNVLQPVQVLAASVA